MRAMWIYAILAGCGGGDPAMPIVDAAIDAAVIDARPEFLGEPCDLPPPGVVRTCHCSRVEDGHCYDPKGFCVDPDGDGAGECRPWCEQISPNWNPRYVCEGPHEGGRVYWTSDGSTTQKPYVCVCLPP